MHVFYPLSAVRKIAPACPSDFRRLILLIQRILDMEVLPDAAGVTLLKDTEAARHAMEEGDRAMARYHLEQLVRFTEALVQADLLASLDSQAVIMTAREILSQAAKEVA